MKLPGSWPPVSKSVRVCTCLGVEPCTGHRLPASKPTGGRRGGRTLLGVRLAGQSTNLLFAEGQELLRAKSYDAAIRKFDKALAHNPFHIPALDERGQALEALGQSDRAVRCRQRANTLRRTLSDL
jgi:hypothetical protein